MVRSLGPGSPPDLQSAAYLMRELGKQGTPLVPSKELGSRWEALRRDVFSRRKSLKGGRAYPSGVDIGGGGVWGLGA